MSALGRFRSLDALGEGVREQIRVWPKFLYKVRQPPSPLILDVRTSTTANDRLRIQLCNASGGSLSEALVLNFAVIKAVAA